MGMLRSQRLRPRRLVAGGTVLFALVAASCSTSDSTSTKTTVAAEKTTTAAPKADATTTVAPKADATTTTAAAPTAAANPFTGNDAFCKAGTPATGEVLQIVQVRQKLEELVKIGFGIEVGDTTDIFQVFADELNKCGGIGGRKVEMKIVEFSPLDPTTRDKICVGATEDNKAFAVVNSTGLQGPAVSCIGVDKKTIYIGTQGAPDADYKAAEGRIVTIDVSLEGSLKHMADYVVANKLTDGKKIGVVSGDLAGLDVVTKTGLVDYLKSKGQNVVSNQVIGCGGKSTCGDGIQAAVEDMKSQGVEILFPTLNIVSLPAFVKELAIQSLKPTIFQSNFNSMGGDLPTDKLVAFGGKEAAAVYNGATIIDWQATGAQRVAGYSADPFGAMCNATYAKGSKVGASFNTKDTPVPFGMVGTVCAIMRIIGRAGFDAGPKVDTASFAKAMGNLGKVDLNGAIPGSITPTKLAVPDEVHTTKVVYPCPTPEFKEGCVVPTTEKPFKITA
jgi:hypothetical protein